MELTSDEDLVMDEKDDVLISPPSGAESLFLGSALETSDITMRTMLDQLQQNKNKHHFRHHKQNSFSGRIKKSGSFHTAQGSNISVDEFMSCVENASDMDSIGSNGYSVNSPPAVRPSHTFMEITDNIFSMASLLKSKKKAVPSPKKAPIVEKPVEPITTPVVPAPVEDEKMKVDAAEVVYGKAKDILAWGKSVPVVSFFVGTSEAVAGKALGVVGTDLSELDGKIESELTKFDAGILNPAIEAIAKILIGVAGKSEATIKPIILALMKPLGLLIKSEANEESPEAHSETPEVTIAK